MSSYILDSLIGKGSDGEVYSLKKENKIIKYIDTKKKLNYLELFIMLYLNNLYINKALEIQKKGTKLKIVQEMAICDLATYLSSNKLSFNQKNNFSRQIISGVYYLNNLNIIHGDIKPENILIFDEALKLTDFNLSRDCRFDKSYKKLYTIYYRPPECRNNYYSLKSDVWALGCTLYEIYYRKRYFKLNNQMMTYHLDIDDKKRDRIFELIKRMLVKEIDKRASIEEVMLFYNIQETKEGRLIIKKDLHFQSHPDIEKICYNLEDTYHPIIEDTFANKYKFKIFEIQK